MFEMYVLIESLPNQHRFRIVIIHTKRGAIISLIGRSRRSRYSSLSLSLVRLPYECVYATLHGRHCGSAVGRRHRHRHRCRY